MTGVEHPDLVIDNDFEYAFDDTQDDTTNFKDEMPAHNRCFSSWWYKLPSRFETSLPKYNDLSCSGSMGTDDIITADFNGDGHMDVGIHNLQGEEDQILINFGDGITYKPPMNDKKTLAS